VPGDASFFPQGFLFPFSSAFNEEVTSVNSGLRLAPLP